MTYILYINIYDMQRYSHHRNRMKGSYLVKKTKQNKTFPRKITDAERRW